MSVTGFTKREARGVPISLESRGCSRLGGPTKWLWDSSAEAGRLAVASDIIPKASDKVIVASELARWCRRVFARRAEQRGRWVAENIECVPSRRPVWGSQRHRVVADSVFDAAQSVSQVEPLRPLRPLPEEKPAKFTYLVIQRFDNIRHLSG